MRFDRIRAKGLGPFRDEVDVDLASLPGVLTAVVGENGAGKSTLLELLGGTLFRVCPTRGSLRDLATERGAWSEVHVVNGAPWRVRQVVDPVSGKSEALIVDAEGRPVVDTAKVRDADAWVRAHLPPSEVLYASTLGVQGSEGFLAMRPAERKAVLLRLLGVERLEALAAAAREHAREARGALAVVEARLGDERRRGGDVEALRAQLDDARARVTAAEAALAVARDGLEKARASAEVERRRNELAARLRPLSERVEALRRTLASAEEIRAAVAERERVQAELAVAESRAREEGDAARTVRAELDRLRAEWKGERERMQRAEEQAVRARARLAGRAAVEEAVRLLPEKRVDVEARERAVSDARALLERLQSQRVAGAEERITKLRRTLDSLAHHRELCHAHDEDMGHPPRDFDEAEVEAMEEEAAGALESDDDAVRRAHELPAEVQRARGDLAIVEEALRCDREALRSMEREAARADELERAAEDLASAERERADASAAAAAIHARAEGLVQQAKAHEAAAAEHGHRAGVLRLESGHLSALADRAPGLAAAEAQLAEVEAQAAQVAAELAALPESELPEGEHVQLAEAEYSAASAETALRSAEKAAATAEHFAVQAEAAAARIAELEAERARVEADLADWNVLAAALGRDGVQADLIDAAGPELTALINDLLRNALGSRWTVTIETTRLDSTGKRQLEGLDVRVIDTERGRDALVETYSGGERVLLGEAVSLALTMLACRRTGAEAPTIVRDESGAALDPERARQWVAMVRRAAELVGASRVLLVSHSAEVADLCDSRLLVADGRVVCS